ncbi:MarR family transcriptional regulator [Marinobacterium zhoushanense]|uniref:MarR family transcriptional regulator n=1 Tax=Marinobacterium zhoushanense TaxID=1679163 RepID=A0ABQ1KM15_9GAMM|nr:MarR family transcriptional regulator [Marinobacterium zhoushanense]GGC01954.1 MarR family transcriptional regulator [Marinobacterium zhoushanense]
MLTELDEICLAHCLRSADRVVSQLYNESLAPLGLRITQFSLLRALHLLGSCNASRLGEVLVLEQASVSRGLQPLIRDGYVQAAEGEDKRERVLRLTREGEALYQQALEPWQHAQAQFRQHLGEHKSEQLVAFSRCIAAMK